MQSDLVLFPFLASICISKLSLTHSAKHLTSPSRAVFFSGSKKIKNKGQKLGNRSLPLNMIIFAVTSLADVSYVVPTREGRNTYSSFVSAFVCFKQQFLSPAGSRVMLEAVPVGVNLFAQGSSIYTCCPSLVTNSTPFTPKNVLVQTID